MRRRYGGTASALAASLLAACAAMPGGSGGGTSFFVTSTGSGKGADLGGLAGADRHCQQLATAAGIGGNTWRAYLSADASGDFPLGTTVVRFMAIDTAGNVGSCSTSITRTRASSCSSC